MALLLGFGPEQPCAMDSDADPPPTEELCGVCGNTCGVKSQHHCDLCKRANHMFCGVPQGGVEAAGSGQPVRCKDGFGCQKPLAPQVSVLPSPTL